MDVLLSVGEQITMAKLAILLTEKGYKAISLTGWQAGIKTDNTNQCAIMVFILPIQIKSTFFWRIIILLLFLKRED